VIALGGIGPGLLPGLIATGFAGAAVMGGVMRAGDPTMAIRDLLAALGAGPA
jgi:thiamine-phosphate pyrophosphorylase